MEITINIDIEGMFQKAINAYVENHFVVNNVKLNEPSVTPHVPQTNDNASAFDVDPDKTVPRNDGASKIGTKTEGAAAPKSKEPEGGWEFGKVPGQRRSKTELALHELELKHGRRLTPEEKGETKATVKLEEEAEENAKTATKEKARIGSMISQANESLEKEEAAAKSTETPPVIKDTSVAALFPEATPEPGGKAFVNGKEVIPSTDMTLTAPPDNGIPQTEDFDPSQFFK